MNITQKIAYRRILRKSHIGTKGTPIETHRSLRTAEFNLLIVFTIILMPILFDAVLWNKMEFIARLWSDIFDFWMNKIPFHGDLSETRINFLGKNIYMFIPEINTYPASNEAIRYNIIGSIIILMFSGFIPKNYLPFTFILRAILLVHISSAVYFIINPDGFPYDTTHYIRGMVSPGLGLIFLISPLLALIYYIFNFPLWKKFAASFIIISYFIIFLPFQYLFHVLIINQFGILYVPVLYLFFGTLLDILMFIGIYSWAMSWERYKVNH